jgi:hypothetical protein
VHIQFSVVSGRQRATTAINRVSRHHYFQLHKDKSLIGHVRLNRLEVCSAGP